MKYSAKEFENTIKQECYKEIREEYPTLSYDEFIQQNKFKSIWTRKLKNTLKYNYKQPINQGIIENLKQIADSLDYNSIIQNIFTNFSQYMPDGKYITFCNALDSNMHSVVINNENDFFDMYTSLMDFDKTLKEYNQKNHKNKQFTYIQCIYIDDINMQKCITDAIKQAIDNLGYSFDDDKYYIKLENTKGYKNYKIVKICSQDSDLFQYIQTNTIHRLNTKENYEKFISTILMNPLYGNYYELIDKSKETLYKFDEYIKNLTNIDKKENKRHFILHVGDTNTGKTYQAIEDLKNANKGCYLAPLRLLALEIYEKLTQYGIKCSFLTGEEYNIIENATHISSTIEELNINEEYDVCVIDETQMIEDKNRGWAWTRALYNVNAKTIHICMSKNALNIVKTIINDCNDTYEVIEHKRDIPLIVQSTNFFFPKSVQDYDALIVFSRKEVINIAAELEKFNIKASVIYGTLPYNARKSELNKFITGETKVLVTTDAIGMGMNLPIKRVVFLQMQKFDGETKRELKHQEIKQIAGRAGRKGIFDNGFVNSITDKKELTDKLSQEYKDIQYISVNYSDDITKYSLPISYSLKLWEKYNISNPLFVKNDVSDEIQLCTFIENNTSTTKEDELRLATICFDIKNNYVYDKWEQLVLSHCGQKQYDFKPINNKTLRKMTLQDIEDEYKKADIFTTFARIENNKKLYDEVITYKETLTNVIIEKLKTITNETKRCPICGKIMPITFPYKLCNSCYALKEIEVWAEEDDL